MDSIICWGFSLKFADSITIQMKEYIDYLLLRLKVFSQNLDRKEVFVDTTWVLIHEAGNYQKYISSSMENW